MHDQAVSLWQHETHVCRTFTSRRWTAVTATHLVGSRASVMKERTALSIVMDDRALRDSETCVVQMLCAALVRHNNGSAVISLLTPTAS